MAPPRAVLEKRLFHAPRFGEADRDLADVANAPLVEVEKALELFATTAPAPAGSAARIATAAR